MSDAFLVARNPETKSRLPFLVRLPIDGGLWLKTGDSWPRTSRVYCHPCSAPPDLAILEVLERDPVVACERRGPAIDLILERALNRRSQFIFTTKRGRPMILWQTAKVAALARPGVRVPFRSGAPALDRILVDTRERYGYTFRNYDVNVERAPVRQGDYLAIVDKCAVAAVERKSADDFVHSLVDGRLAFSLAELTELPTAAIVVETSYSRLLRSQHVSSAFLADILARLQVRYPRVQVVFAENRSLGEQWTYAYFRAAAAEHDKGTVPLLPLLLSPPTPPRRRRAKPTGS